MEGKGVVLFLSDVIAGAMEHCEVTATGLFQPAWTPCGTNGSKVRGTVLPSGQSGIVQRVSIICGHSWWTENLWGVPCYGLLPQCSEEPGELFYPPDLSPPSVHVCNNPHQIPGRICGMSMCLVYLFTHFVLVGARHCQGPFVNVATWAELHMAAVWEISCLLGSPLSVWHATSIWQNLNIFLMHCAGYYFMTLSTPSPVCIVGCWEMVVAILCLFCQERAQTFSVWLTISPASVR